MSDDFTRGYSTRACLVVGIMWLALTACSPAVDVSVASTLPTRAPTAASATEPAQEQASIEAQPPTAKPQADSPQPTQTPTLLPVPPTEVAPTATATSMPTATPSSGPISLPLLNKDRPADILQEIAVYGGGGGGPANCYDVFAYMDGEDWQLQSPRIAFQQPEPPVAWLDRYELDTCGWIPGERVFISLFYNDQPLDYGGAPYVDEWGSMWINIVFSREYPPGVYRFILNGPNGRIDHAVQVNGPQGPTLYHFFDEGKNDTGELLLSGFQPGEMIRLVVYAGDSPPFNRPFAGWASVQAGRDGQLSVIIPPAGNIPTDYAAIGELSGEAESIRAYTELGHMGSLGSAYSP